MGLISNWWQRQHGRQLGITATLSGSIGILFGASIYQLLFLQNHVSLGDYTGHSIGLAVFSSLALLIVLPEFLHCAVMSTHSRNSNPLNQPPNFVVVKKKEMKQQMY